MSYLSIEEQGRLGNPTSRDPANVSSLPLPAVACRDAVGILEVTGVTQ